MKLTPPPPPPPPPLPSPGQSRSAKMPQIVWIVRIQGVSFCGMSNRDEFEVE